MIIVSRNIYLRPGAREGYLASSILRAQVFRHVVSSTGPA